MNRIMVTLVLVLIILSIGGCAGSKVHVTRFDLGTGKGKIAVMPWTKAEKQLFANDAERRGEMLTGVGGNAVEAALYEAVDEWTGMFTYTFDEYDYANLRASVIQSLQKSEAFSDVLDVSDAPPPEDGHRLVLKFFESGIVQTPATSKCILIGSARVEKGSADVAPARPITIEATSLLSVSGAKSKAMKMYLAQIGELLKSLD